MSLCTDCAIFLYCTKVAPSPSKKNLPNVQNKGGGAGGAKAFWTMLKQWNQWTKEHNLGACKVGCFKLYEIRISLFIYSHNCRKGRVWKASYFWFQRAIEMIICDGHIGKHTFSLSFGIHQMTKWVNNGKHRMGTKQTGWARLWNLYSFCIHPDIPDNRICKGPATQEFINCCVLCIIILYIHFWINIRGKC